MFLNGIAEDTAFWNDAHNTEVISVFADSLYRNPTKDEVIKWVNSGLHGDELANAIIQSFAPQIVEMAQVTDQGTIQTLHVAAQQTAEVVSLLYRQMLNRLPTQEEANYWNDAFGPTIDANEIEAFKAAAQKEIVANVAAAAAAANAAANAAAAEAAAMAEQAKAAARTATADAAARAAAAAAAAKVQAAQEKQTLDFAKSEIAAGKTLQQITDDVNFYFDKNFTSQNVADYLSAHNLQIQTATQKKTSTNVTGSNAMLYLGGALALLLLLRK